MNIPLSRRKFLCAVSGAAVGVAGRGFLQAAETAALPPASASHLPRWRGFNLLDKFNGRNDPFVETDFEWIHELGFNFVRLPMDYRGWIENRDWTKFREQTFKEIDQAIGFGEKHQIHAMLNFHRAPGYTVAKPEEEKSVWTDPEAQRVCALHWAKFAKRYQGIPNSRLSFNLFNEPGRVEPARYRETVSRMAEAIRREDPKRLIVCDGREWGNVAPTELLGLQVAAATRGYQPFKLTHYLASWASNGGRWEAPTYPLKDGSVLWDKEMMRKRLIEPWKNLEQQGIGVMVGEFGAFNKTPHAVVLPWLRDCLSLWKEAGWGWALWNFRGGFGVLDSGREDVEYESWRGHKLDRAMLKLLQTES